MSSSSKGRDDSATFKLPGSPDAVFDFLGNVLMTLLRHARKDEAYQASLLWRAARLSIEMHEEIERIDGDNLRVLDDLRLRAEWGFPVCSDFCADESDRGQV